MKAIVSKIELRDALSRVIPAVAIKPSTPVLAGIYLQAKGDSLTLRATNFDLDITTTIPATVEAEGETVTAGKALAPIAKKLGGDIVTLKTTGNDQLDIRSEAANFQLVTMDPSDFPTLRKFTDEVITFRVNSDTLKDLIRRTAFATAKDNGRPLFTGVNFTLNGTEIKAVGTNASRVAIAKGEILDAAEASMTISANDVRALQSALESDISIRCELDRAYVAFEFDNTSFVTRLIDGTFPPTDKIIPPSFTTVAEINRKELVGAIDRVQLITAGADYKALTLKFTNEGLELSATSSTVGNAVEHIDADVTGDDIELGINYQYLTDALKIFGSKIIKIGINQPLSLVMFTGEDDPDFIYIATPLRTH